MQWQNGRPVLTPAESAAVEKTWAQQLPITITLTEPDDIRWLMRATVAGLLEDRDPAMLSLLLTTTECAKEAGKLDDLWAKTQTPKFFQDLVQEFYFAVADDHKGHEMTPADIDKSVRGRLPYTIVLDTPIALGAVLNGGFVLRGHNARTVITILSGLSTLTRIGKRDKMVEFFQRLDAPTWYKTLLITEIDAVAAMPVLP